MSDVQIHWFAICNSVAIVLFLSGEREGGREGESQREREGGRESEREKGREGGREGERLESDRGSQRGREGGREGEIERGEMEGGIYNCTCI